MPAAFHAVCLLYVATAVAGLVRETSASDSNQCWRTRERQAVNCLYMFLRCHDVGIDYEALRTSVEKKANGMHLADLKVVAEDCGFPVQVRQCKPDELGDQPLPLLVLMEHGNDPCDYAVLISQTTDGCTLITGHGTYQELTADRFRRYWTGYAIVPCSKRPIQIALVCLVVFVTYGWLRFRPRVRKTSLHNTAQSV